MQYGAGDFTKVCRHPLHNGQHIRRQGKSTRGKYSHWTFLGMPWLYSLFIVETNSRCKVIQEVQRYLFMYGLLHDLWISIDKSFRHKLPLWNYSSLLTLLIYLRAYYSHRHPMFRGSYACQTIYMKLSIGKGSYHFYCPVSGAISWQLQQRTH